MVHKVKSMGAVVGTYQKSVMGEELEPQATTVERKPESKKVGRQHGHPWLERLGGFLEACGAQDATS